MAKTTNRIFVDKMGGRDVSEYIGISGELFYDPNTGVIKLADGTPGGKGIAESSPMESLYKGEWVYFVRPDNKPEVVDVIAPNLILARAQGGLIYNTADSGEGPFDQNGYELATPYGTQWNTQGWGDLSDTTSRYYENLANSMAGGGWALPKHEFIMHDTQNDKYYAIRFLTWDSGNNNATGAFSYIRREINTDIYFSRIDTDDEETAYVNGDAIDEGLTITRGNGGPIFNFATHIAMQSIEHTSFDSATWVGRTITFVNPTGGLLDALNSAKAGDEIYFNSNVVNGGTEVAAGAYNPATGVLNIAWNQDGAPATVSSIIISTPVLQPQETYYNGDQSPVGTLWNAEGHDDLSNLKSRQWMVFDDLWAGELLGERIVGKQLVMWDTVNDKYYAITFTRWQQGNAGFAFPGFSYTRRKIDVNKLTAGLKFADGTVQNTAYSEKIAGTLNYAPKLSSTVSDRYITPADIGRTIYLNSATTTGALRLTDGGTADFPVGSTITIINRTQGIVYLVKQNSNEQGTIYGAGTSDQGTSWQIPDNGGGNVATLIKIESGQDPNFSDWMLAGANIALDI